MPTYSIKLIQKNEVAAGTLAFYFEKPDGFSFKAGQYGDFSLIKPPYTDEEGTIRSFSLANAPYEERLMIATRMRPTAFKKILDSMAMGSPVKMEAPLGSFTLHSDASRPAVFLAGGIGITPFRSMILQAVKDNLPHQLFLFYSNRGTKDAPFLEELTRIAADNSRLTLIPTMTQEDPSWRGQKGYIDQTLITKYIPEPIGPMYYLTGPPPMVAAMRSVLELLTVKDDDIKTEEFTGY